MLFFKGKFQHKVNKTGTLFPQHVKTTVTHWKKNSIPAEISSQFPAHMPLKETPGKNARWPENAETTPILPPAGFVWFSSVFLQLKYFFSLESELVGHSNIGLLYKRKAGKGWFMT